MIKRIFQIAALTMATRRTHRYKHFWGRRLNQAHECREVVHFAKLFCNLAAMQKLLVCGLLLFFKPWTSPLACSSPTLSKQAFVAKFQALCCAGDRVVNKEDILSWSLRHIKGSTRLKRL